MEIEMEEENNIDNLKDEYELATKLKDLGILREPTSVYAEIID